MQQQQQQPAPQLGPSSSGSSCGQAMMPWPVALVPMPVHVPLQEQEAQAQAGPGDLAPRQARQQQHQQQLGQLLTPLEFIHWLYLQPPADAEVLVQACGRSFVTSWDPVQQHWLTQELPPGYRHLPELLPRISHVDVPCLALHPPAAEPAGARGGGVAPLQQLLPGPSTASTPRVLPSPPAQPCHKLLLFGSSLSSPDASFAACLHGQYLRVESRAVPLPANSSSSLGPSSGGMGSTHGDPHVTTSSSVAQGHWPPGRGPGRPSGAVADCVEVVIYGITQPGLMQLECWCGRLLTCRKQIAVVRSPAVQAELAQYFSVGLGTSASADSGAQHASSLLDFVGSEASGGLGGFLLELPAAGGSGSGLPGEQLEERKVDDLMTDLGCWVDFVAAMHQLCAWFGVGPAQLQAADAAQIDALLTMQPRLGARGAGGRSSGAARAGPQGDLDLSQPLLQACLTPAYRAQMADTAVQLLAHSCSCAWVETAGSLLADLVSLGLAFRDIKQRATAGSGSSLLHRAVCSKSPRMIRAVWDWGVRYGPEWTWAEADPRNGITPLHMAAALDALPAPSSAGGPGPGPAAQRLLLNSTTSTGRASSLGSTLADWILQEYQAAYQYWHGAEDASGMTPADVAERHSFLATPAGSSSPDNVLASLPGGSDAVVATLGERLAGAAVGALPFGSNLDSAGDSVLEDPGAAGPPSRHAIADLAAAGAATAAAEITAEPVMTAALVRGASASSRATSASVQDWVHLQQRLAASQPQLVGPPDLTAGEWEGGPAAGSPRQAAAAAGVADPTRGAAGAAPAAAAAVGPAAAAAAGLPAPADGGTDSASGYRALVSALHHGVYGSDAQDHDRDGVQAPASALNVQQQQPSGGSTLPAPGATAAAAAAAARGPVSGALERQAPSSTSSTAAAAAGAVPNGSPSSSPDMQLVTELLSPPQLLAASMAKFRSRRLEGSYLVWLELRRRARLRGLLPCCMLLITVVAVLKEALATQPSHLAAGACLSLGLYALPWLLMLSSSHWAQLGLTRQGQGGGTMHRHGHLQHAQRRLSDEQMWLLIMLWHLLLRCLQAAGTLALPSSVVRFLTAGGDCVTDGFLQVLFQVRTRHLPVLRLLYALSSAALYIRVRAFPPAHAVLVAAAWNALCLLAAWLLDLFNRRAYLLQLLQHLQHKQQGGGQPLPAGGQPAAASRAAASTPPRITSSPAALRSRPASTAPRGGSPAGGPAAPPPHAPQLPPGSARPAEGHLHGGGGGGAGSWRAAGVAAVAATAAGPGQALAGQASPGAAEQWAVQQPGSSAWPAGPSLDPAGAMAGPGAAGSGVAGRAGPAPRAGSGLAAGVPVPAGRVPRQPRQPLWRPAEPAGQARQPHPQAGEVQLAGEVPAPRLGHTASSTRRRTAAVGLQPAW